MKTLTLLKSQERHNYALYKDGELVANYSHNDYREYIDDQISKWMTDEDELVERDHSGEFPEKLEAKKAVKPKPPAKKAEADS